MPSLIERERKGFPKQTGKPFLSLLTYNLAQTKDEHTERRD